MCRTIALLLALLSAFVGSVFAQVESGRVREPFLEWKNRHSEINKKIEARRTRRAANTSKRQEARLQSGSELLNISNDDFAQQETSVAINRLNPDLMIVGSNDDAMDVRSMPVYRTSDGGKTWNTYRIPRSPSGFQALGDPAIAAAPDGKFYYAYLIYHDDRAFSDILVSYSDDGMNWTYEAPVVGNDRTGVLADKESIDIDRDPESPTYGRIYLSYMHFDSSYQTSGLRLTWSDDGTKTWHSPVAIDTSDGFFSQVRVGKGGIVYYTCSEYATTPQEVNHYLLASTDFGASFTKRIAARFVGYPYNSDVQNQTLKGEGGFRSFPYATFDCDHSSGEIRLIYGSYRSWPNGKNSATLQYITSDDNGITWTTKEAIGFQGDSVSLERDRYQPWISIDDATGDAHLFFFSSETDTANIRTLPYWVRLNNTNAWEYRQLTDSVFDPLTVINSRAEVFLGDYTGCEAYQRHFIAAWTQNRPGRTDAEIYAYVSDNVDSVQRNVKLVQVTANRLAVVSVTPNPVTLRTINVRYAVPHSGEVNFSVADITGKIHFEHTVANEFEGVHEKEFVLPVLARGSYVLTIESGGETASSLIVIE